MRPCSRSTASACGVPATSPGLAIFVTTPAIHLLGDGLRDRLDPRSRKLLWAARPVPGAGSGGNRPLLRGGRAPGPAAAGSRGKATSGRNEAWRSAL